jgi:hypothetical protein
MVSDEEIKEFEKNGFLTTHLVMEANLQVQRTERTGSTMSGTDTAVYEQLKKIEAALDEFNVEVWLLWLYSRQANEQDHKYLEANAANVNMLVGSMAGRCMVTLRWRDRDTESEEGHHFVSFVGAEKLTLMDMGEDRPKHVHGLCGFQGIGMNGDSAVELIQEAVRVTQELANDISKASDTVGFG